ncbi:MAG: hypothetical protein IJI01_01500 [Butyrivibrio sp.]|uniref:hypothetical protein n=1 Tax=Butyrivibrio sp. TaxID=28121 RepID=UPI0025BD30C0|nr:hypothetical protein [Butyrivibrio sp.]MBQ6587336.1 hypothetical protein [Butyrivibrio sp.]
MKSQSSKKLLTLTAILSLAAMTLTGCGSAEAASDLAEFEVSEITEEVIEEESVALAAEAETSEAAEAIQYFKKGVYVNYAKDAEDPAKNYFYVFNGDDWGRTEEGSNGAGIPFDCVQEDGQVRFSFGSVDVLEDVLVVTGVEDRNVYGYYDDDMKLELVFEYLPDADPDTFNAINYVSDGDYIYENQNGWSIKYDPNLFDITQDGNKVAIVYNGEGVGTNMIMVTYDVDKSAKEARDAFVQEYGENATTSEGVFPGTEEIHGYWASCPPAETGSGLYMEAVTRDYMEGYLSFEVIGHKSGNEELDMEVSDRLAGIIDSLTFLSF